jgi:hypothetical protein
MSQQQPELRIGDADREAAVSSLGEHYAAGRLTKDEFDERSDQAWSAKTASQLWPLFADLPRPRAAGGPTRAPQAVRPQPRGGRGGHPGWRFGGAFAPLLLVVAVLVVLTHLPVFVLVGLIWLFLARTNHAWVANRRHHSQRVHFR